MQITAFVLLLSTSFGLISLQRVPGIPKRPTITSSGWPPRVIVTWKTIVPQEENGTLTYDVICCTCNHFRCAPAIKRLSNGFNSSRDLQVIHSCQRSSSQPGLTFQCNVTGVKNCQQNSPQLNTRYFYAVIKVSNSFGANYSSYRFLDLFDNSKCTQPSGFTGAISANRTVKITYANPLYMGVRTGDLKFSVSYAAHASKCSNVGNQNQTLKNCRFSCEVSGLLPDTHYTFYVACSPRYLNSVLIWGESAVFTIKTSKEAPSIAPTNVEGSEVTFGKKRNITVQWKAPSCSTEWGAKPKAFTINYWPSIDRNSTSMALETNGEQRNSSLAGSLEITNTSSRSAVIGYLDRYTSYLVTVKMCSSVGCGPAGPATFFEANKEVQHFSQSTTVSGGPTVRMRLTGMIALSVVGGICAILVVAIIIRCVIKKRSSYPVEYSIRALRERVDDVRPQVSTDEVAASYDSLCGSRTSLKRT